MLGVGKHTFVDQKCFVQVVKETHGKKDIIGQNWIFPYTRRKKNVFFSPSHTAFFTIAQKCNQSKQPKYLLLGGWIIKLLDIHIEELYTSIKKRTNKT